MTIGIQNVKCSKIRKLTFGMQNAVNWELKSKCKNREVQKDSESEIILKSVNFTKLRILLVRHAVVTISGTTAF